MTNKKNRYRSHKSSRSGTLRTWIKTVFGVVAITGTAVLLSAALAHSYHRLMEAPWLRVGEIQILGAKHLERREILNTMGVPRNANILTLKMPKLADRLRALPWVQSAVVRLDLPGRIVVEITERQPVAVITAEDTFLMDKEGRLFVQATPEQNPDLFAITGFSGLALHQGSSIPAEALDEVRNLMAAFHTAQIWLPPKQIASCQWKADEGFTLTSARNNAPIRLGSEELEAKLHRLRRVFGMLEERQWLDMVTRIDLDYSNRTFVEGNFPRSKAPHAS